MPLSPLLITRLAYPGGVIALEIAEAIMISPTRRLANSARRMPALHISRRKLIFTVRNGRSVNTDRSCCETNTLFPLLLTVQALPDKSAPTIGISTAALLHRHPGSSVSSLPSPGDFYAVINISQSRWDAGARDVCAKEREKSRRPSEGATWLPEREIRAINGAAARK